MLATGSVYGSTWSIPACGDVFVASKIRGDLTAVLVWKAGPGLLTDSQHD